MILQQKRNTRWFRTVNPRKSTADIARDPLEFRGPISNPDTTTERGCITASVLGKERLKSTVQWSAIHSPRRSHLSALTACAAEAPALSTRGKELARPSPKRAGLRRRLSWEGHSEEARWGGTLTLSDRCVQFTTLL